MILSIQNLTKTFKIPHEKRSTLKEHFVGLFKKRGHTKLDVIKNLNLNIEKGDFFGIIGPNGSGKSTLLKLMAQIYQPNQGTIKTTAKIAPFLELGIGFQQELTGRENIFINAALLGLTHTETKARLKQIIDFAELEQFIDLKVKNYSSGMRSRLAFAIATQIDADIYLCDEIMAVGDARFQEKCITTFKKWHQQGKTIVLVSHNTDTINAFCNRAALIDHGQLIIEGAPREVTATYHDRNSRRARHPASPLKITQVATEKPEYDTGEPITIRVHYETEHRIEKPVFGIALHHEDGTHITGPNTKTSKLNIDRIENKGHLDCILTTQNLLGGTYLISASCFNNDLTLPYDYHDKRFAFTIRKNRANQYGVVDLSANWHLDRS